MSDARSTQPQDFAATHGLRIRERSRWRRPFQVSWDFTRRKPLGAFGFFIVIVWLFLAIGTMGGGGGWLGLGRYDSTAVFRDANLTFADSQAANVLDGKPADISQAELRELFADSEFLGGVAVQSGVVEALHAYILDQIEQGTLIEHLASLDPAQIEISGGTIRDHDDLFATGTDTPTVTSSLRDPSGRHWLGTDRAGHDLYARVTEGARLSLQIGFFAALIATVVGTLLGLGMGFAGGLWDLLGNRLMDAIQAFPPIVFLLLLAAVTRQGSIWMTVAALSVLGFAPINRIVRGSVLATNQEPYVEAARAIGAGGTRIAIRHILPNIVAPIIVVFSISIGAYILAEATLSFLGLGPTAISWGKMISDGRQFIVQSPWTSLWSGLALTSLVFGFNIAGDALRDVLDPRLRQA